MRGSSLDINYNKSFVDYDDVETMENREAEEYIRKSMVNLKDGSKKKVLFTKLLNSSDLISVSIRFLNREDYRMISRDKFLSKLQRGNSRKTVLEKMR